MFSDLSAKAPCYDHAMVQAFCQEKDPVGLMLTFLAINFYKIVETQASYLKRKRVTIWGADPYLQPGSSDKGSLSLKINSVSFPIDAYWPTEYVLHFNNYFRFTTSAFLFQTFLTCHLCLAFLLSHLGGSVGLRFGMQTGIFFRSQSPPWFHLGVFTRDHR